MRVGGGTGMEEVLEDIFDHGQAAMAERLDDMAIVSARGYPASRRKVTSRPRGSARDHPTT